MHSPPSWVRTPLLTTIVVSAGLIGSSALAYASVNQVQLGHDLFASGDSVRLDTAIEGDAMAAGSSVRLNAPVHGDGVFAGSLVTLQAPIGGDLYAAGRRVELGAHIAGNARIVGAEVSIAPQTKIDGSLTIGAGQVEVGGTVNEYAQVFAGTTRITGTVLGNLNVSGGELFIEPSAKVLGEVTFHGSRPATIAPNAQLNGSVKYTPTDQTSELGASAVVALIALALAWWLGVALLSVAFWRLCPQLAQRVTHIAKQQTLKAFGLGLAIAVAGPPILITLSLLVVGLPLAVFGLFAFILVFPLGYVVGCGAIAQHMFGPRSNQHWSRQLLATLGVLLAAAAFAAVIPVVGSLCTFAIAMIGAGSFVLSLMPSARQLEVPTESSPHTGSTTDASRALGT